jgi:hypothetical protein
MTVALRSGLPPLPPQMKRLPIDPRGFPVPWFTPKVDGEWNFQTVHPMRVRQAFVGRLCWICGTKLHKNLAFCIGPMCAINRTTSEPASHVECATFAAKACPFLTRPRMRRAPLPDDALPMPGIHLDRNPGVVLLWVCRSYTREPVGNGYLFNLGEPVRVEAFAEGRPATPNEIEESIAGGLPALRQVADIDPDPEGARIELRGRILMARKLLNLYPRAEA